MKYIKYLALLILTTSLFAFDTYVNNVPTITKQDRVADLKVTETQSNEFTNSEIVITIHNGILLNTVNNYNVVSGNIFSSEFEVNGTIGTNRIVIKITNDTSELDSFTLVNVYVIPLCDECDIEYDISVYGQYVSQDTVVVAHKELPPRTYISYFTNVGKWWTGSVIINNRNETITVYAEFHTSTNTFIKSYTVPAKGMYVIAMYNDSDLDEQSGWFSVMLPSDVECFTLIGDGIQSYKF